MRFFLFLVRFSKVVAFFSLLAALKEFLLARKFIARSYFAKEHDIN